MVTAAVCMRAHLTATAPAAAAAAAAGLQRTTACTGWAKKKLRQIFLAITLVNMDRF